MKATGIVRRIDDLGRIVIPKEIRRTLRIRETDPLEIFTDKEGEIILKKYSPIGELGAFAKDYAESLAQTTGHTVCVSDRDQIIAAAGPDKKDMIKKNITKKIGAAFSITEAHLLRQAGTGSCAGCGESGGRIQGTGIKSDYLRRRCTRSGDYYDKRR